MGPPTNASNATNVVTAITILIADLITVAGWWQTEAIGTD